VHIAYIPFQGESLQSAATLAMHSYEDIASTGKQGHITPTYDAALSKNTNFRSVAIA
jgi:hypothetical protein